MHFTTNFRYFSLGVSAVVALILSSSLAWATSPGQVKKFNAQVKMILEKDPNPDLEELIECRDKLEQYSKDYFDDPKYDRLSQESLELLKQIAAREYSYYSGKNNNRSKLIRTELNQKQRAISNKYSGKIREALGLINRYESLLQKEREWPGYVFHRNIIDLDSPSPDLAEERLTPVPSLVNQVFLDSATSVVGLNAKESLAEQVEATYKLTHRVKNAPSADIKIAIIEANWEKPTILPLKVLKLGVQIASALKNQALEAKYLNRILDLTSNQLHPVDKKNFGVHLEYAQSRLRKIGDQLSVTSRMSVSILGKRRAEAEPQAIAGGDEERLEMPPLEEVLPLSHRSVESAQVVFEPFQDSIGSSAPGSHLTDLMRKAKSFIDSNQDKNYLDLKQLYQPFLEQAKECPELYADLLLQLTFSVPTYKQSHAHLHVQERGARLEDLRVIIRTLKQLPRNSLLDSILARACLEISKYPILNQEKDSVLPLSIELSRNNNFRFTLRKALIQQGLVFINTDRKDQGILSLEEAKNLYWNTESRDPDLCFIHSLLYKYSKKQQYAKRR